MVPSWLSSAVNRNGTLLFLCSLWDRWLCPCINLKWGSQCKRILFLFFFFWSTLFIFSKNFIFLSFFLDILKTHKFHHKIYTHTHTHKFHIGVGESRILLSFIGAYTYFAKYLFQFSLFFLQQVIEVFHLNFGKFSMQYANHTLMTGKHENFGYRRSWIHWLSPSWQAHEKWEEWGKYFCAIICYRSRGECRN